VAADDVMGEVEREGGAADAQAVEDAGGRDAPERGREGVDVDDDVFEERVGAAPGEATEAAADLGDGGGSVGTGRAHGGDGAERDAVAIDGQEEGGVFVGEVAGAGDEEFGEASPGRGGAGAFATEIEGVGGLGR
jgi:hypothetical protein